MTAIPTTDGRAIPASPWRHDGVTTTCPACGHPFVPAGRQRWCSAACRAAGYRRRKPAAGPAIILPTPRLRIPANPDTQSGVFGHPRGGSGLRGRVVADVELGVPLKSPPSGAVGRVMGVQMGSGGSCQVSPVAGLWRSLR